jgi:hypothetical protein
LTGGAITIILLILALGVAMRMMISPTVSFEAWFIPRRLMKNNELFTHCVFIVNNP